MDIQIFSNGLLLLLISILFAWLAVAEWHVGRSRVASLWIVLAITFFRFSGRFVERGGGPKVGIDAEWVITINYLLIFVATLAALAETVWEDWKERMG